MNLKLKKKLNILLTVVMVLCIVLCLFVCLQVISGREASIFGFRLYHILTGSMEPTIPTGTSILVHEVDAETLKVGDIITFISQDQAIYGSANTHRIVAVENDADGQLCFRTRGDANSAEDLQLVYPENIKGKVVFHLNASVLNFFGFMRTKLGFATVILLPMMLIVGWVARDFKRSVNEYVRTTEVLRMEEAAAEAAAQPAAEPESEPEAEPESEPAAEPEAEPEAEPAAEPEAEPEEEPEEEPEAPQEAEELPAE